MATAAGANEVRIGWRDFGRLEGKVDAIAEDVHELKQAAQGLDGRVRKIETCLSTADTRRKEKQESEGLKMQETEASQMTYQTKVMIGATVVSVMALFVAVWAAVVH
jgi:hypothetical protein